MSLVARIGDTIDHGGRVVSGSASAFAEGMPVARLGDLVLCEQHGLKKIIQTDYANVMVEGKPVAHIGATCECGAKIITGAATCIVDAGSPGDIIGLTFLGNDDPGGNGGVIPPTPGGRAATRDEQNRSRAIAPPPAGPPTATDTEQPPTKEGTPTDCSKITEPVPDDFRLSANYTLAQLSTSAAAGSHKVVAQHGLTAAQIVCNLKAVAENILEPLRTQFPGLVVNSGFRTGSGSSQHERGQAVDVSWANIRGNRQAFYERAQWVKSNLAFDQLILECPGGSTWLHISYSSSGLRQDVRSFYGSGYPSGLILNI